MVAGVSGYPHLPRNIAQFDTGNLRYIFPTTNLPNSKARVQYSCPVRTRVRLKAWNC